ncbi:MAG TPA: plastocyanin/azurin family copper-binding protein [Gemmatimonadaceae bacterium]|jgi:plastocyanin
MRHAKFISLFISCVLAGCGGSGDSGGTNPPPTPVLTSVTLSKTAATLRPTESTTITATPKDQNGNAMSGQTVDWTIAPTSGIASITPNGTSVTVTGTALGSAALTATVQQKTATAQITVQNSFPSSADIAVGANGANAFDPQQVDIAAGGTVNFNWSGVTHNVTWQAPPVSVSNIADRSSGTVSVTLNTAGTYNYQCTLHAGMTGTVTVH